jgi:hypothetical protein
MSLDHNNMNQTLAAVLFFSLSMMGCFEQSPTGANRPAGIALQLRVAKWALLQPDQEKAIARASALAQITRVEVYVTLEDDTLAHASVPISPGAEEFSASLEVPAGENRRIIVEAWDDLGSEGGSVAGLILRGIQTNVTIVAEEVQGVPLTLYPIPIAGRRVVLATGSASGVAGSSGNWVPFTLVSADSLSGIQFDLNFDPAVISPQGVVPDAALPWSTVESNLINNGQTLRVLMFDSNGGRLPIFYDPATLANIDIRVHAEVAVGASSPLVISNALVLDANRAPLEVAAVENTFHIVEGR